MAKIIIFGTGKGAIIATKYFRHDSGHEIVAYTMHEKYLQGDTFNDLPVVPFETIENKYATADFQLFAPLGYDEMNKFRARIFEEGKAKGYTFATYVHSSVKTIEPLNIGENCFILENQSINLDVRIGNNVTMWSANQVGDRSVIEDHVWISSHVCISGDVHIKAYSVLAVNCTVANNVVVEEENFIGANALVSKSTLPKEVYIVSPTAKAPLASDRFIRMIKRV
jgi:sugar O-acyltransferase (sialic acid O-acetyltransferase NeuD family)